MKKLALGIVVALLTSVSLAGTISVNLCDWQSDALPSRNPMLSSSLAGAPGVRTNNWNNLMARVAITNTGSSLVYDNGTTIGGAFKIVFTTPRAGQMPTNALSAMGNDALMYSGYDQVWNGQTGTVVLTDIPFSSYDLYIYTDAANANGGGRVSVVGQQDYYLKTKSAMLMTTNTGAGYVQITNTTQASAVSGPQGSGNYVKYSGLSGSGQTFTFAALDMGSVNHRLALNGFQIVQAAEAPPVASFTASPVTGAVPLVVTFTDTSTGTITNRFWTFGDGATSNTTATSVAHTYASTGTYSVALIVSGSLGSSTNTQSNFITASAPIPPTAAFSATPTNGIYPLLVNFTDTSIGTITNRFWNFGDGATTNTTATSVSHTYTSAGTNTVQLIVSGSAGSATNTQSNLITVSVPPPPTAGFSASPTSGVVSLMVFFSDNSTGAITNRYWDFGDGTTTNITATSVSHTYTVGTRTVQLTASGPGGSATNTQVDLIRVEPLPANVSRVTASTADRQLTSIGGLANNTTATAGSGSPVTTTNTYVIPFQLPTIPAGKTITNVQFSAFLISSYPHAVQSVYVDVFGGRVDASSTVLSNTDWSASTAIGDNIAQISKDYTATNMVKSAVLTASFFQDIYDTDTNAAGKYVFLTLRPDAASPNASAYTTWATADSTTLPKPTLDFSTGDGPAIAGFSASPTSGMSPLAVTFTDTSVGSITNRFWDFGDGATSNTTATSVAHTYTAGTYSVSLTVSGALGVSTNTQNDVITVSAPVAPTAAFSASPTSGVVSLMVNFTDTSTGTITSRYWDFGDGETSNTTATSVGHTYSSTGTYSVALTVSGPAGVSTNTQVNLIRVHQPLPSSLVHVTASTADRQLTSIGGFSDNITATVGSGSPVTTTNTYVIPFQLPTLTVGQTITNVQFNAFLISTYPYGTTNIQVYVDIFGGRVDASSTVLSNTDWSASTAIGDNIAQISKDYTATNMVKSAVLTASFFQDIYDTDTNASGKYVFLTLRPDAASPNASAYTTWATADSTNHPKPTLDIYIAGEAIMNAKFSASPTSGVSPLAVTFTDTSTGSITNRFWDFGDGATSNTTATSVDHTYTAGTYSVSLTVSGAGGASTNTQSNVITVSAPVAPPTAGFTASPTSGVSSLAVTFTDTSTGSITNRFWDFGDGATSNTTATSVGHTYTAGTYTVSLIVSGDGGSSTNTQSNVITASEPVVVPPPAPTVALGSSGSFGRGQDVISWSTVQGSGYVYSVYWSTNLRAGFHPLKTNLADTVQRLTNIINAPAVFYRIECQ